MVKRTRINVNPQKAELVLYSNKRKMVNIKIPTLCGSILSLTEEVKSKSGFMSLDLKLNWNKQKTK